MRSFPELLRLNPQLLRDTYHYRGVYYGAGLWAKRQVVVENCETKCHLSPLERTGIPVESYRTCAPDADSSLTRVSCTSRIVYHLSRDARGFDR